ncbi:hypothetical protein [Actinoallomurus iriomotensis]|nr:hypothetical protein [Actinoallomurus iriomotensis]
MTAAASPEPTPRPTRADPRDATLDRTRPATGPHDRTRTGR